MVLKSFGRKPNENFSSDLDLEKGKKEKEKQTETETEIEPSLVWQVGKSIALAKSSFQFSCYRLLSLHRVTGNLCRQTAAAGAANLQLAAKLLQITANNNNLQHFQLSHRPRHGSKLKSSYICCSCTCYCCCCCCGLV